MDGSTRWADWLIKLRALCQTGLTYTKDQYDVERYRAIAALADEMHSALTGDSIESIARIFLPDKGYATPKVDLRGAVFQNDRILLVRERGDGLWTLPGGWADVLERPSQGVIREVLEESGFVVEKPRLVAVVDRGAHEYVPAYPWHIYKLFFICQLVSGKATVSQETDAVQFFARDKLPPLSIDRLLPKDLERLFEANVNPHIPLYVD
jgi:ADP-ribose pyrophosphatase YjhB (NUDIX family)